MLYPSKITRYYQELKYAGSFSEMSINIITARAGSVSAGEIMQIQIKLNDQRQVIDVKYKVHGCGYAIACCAYTCEHMMGKALAEVKLTAVMIIEALQLPEQKYHSALLAEDCFKQLRV